MKARRSDNIGDIVGFVKVIAAYFKRNFPGLICEVETHTIKFDYVQNKPRTVPIKILEKNANKL